MFTPEERGCLRSGLLELAASDQRISGAAITGSAAVEREDAWSDIDLAFGIADAAELPKVLADWTAHMYEHHSALDHVDVKAAAWTYRVFLLANTLQVDLAFVPAAEFRPLSPTFRLVSGNANQRQQIPPAPPTDIIGMAWLYALHARSCIARGRLWQAEYMISGVRDNVLALACLRHGLPTVHGRGMDLLPAGVGTPFEGSLVRRLDATELSRAFRVVIDGLLSEIGIVDPLFAARLQMTLSELTEHLR